MAKIGILELGAHDQHLYALCRIAGSLGYRVTVFTEKDNRNKMEEYFRSVNLQVEWAVKKTDKPLGRFFDEVQSYCDRNIDVFIADSIFLDVKNFLSYYRLDPGCKKMLCIYNLNRWLDTKISFRNGIKTNVQKWMCSRVLSNYQAIDLGNKRGQATFN